MYRPLTWSRDIPLRLAQCVGETFTFRIMVPQLASSLVAPPRICGSRHMVLSRISSVVGDALMLIVMKPDIG
jgi:hypothetical protein